MKPAHLLIHLAPPVADGRNENIACKKLTAAEAALAVSAVSVDRDRAALKRYGNRFGSFRLNDIFMHAAHDAYFERLFLRAEAQVKPRADVDKLAELACSLHRYICVKSGNNVIPLIVNGFHDVNMALWTLWIRQVGPRAAGDVLDELIYYIMTGNVDGVIGFYTENAAELLSKI